MYQELGEQSFNLNFRVMALLLQWSHLNILCISPLGCLVHPPLYRENHQQHQIDNRDNDIAVAYFSGHIKVVVLGIFCESDRGEGLN